MKTEELFPDWPTAREVLRAYVDSIDGWEAKVEAGPPRRLHVGPRSRFKLRRRVPRGHMEKVFALFNDATAPYLARASELISGGAGWVPDGVDGLRFILQQLNAVDEASERRGDGNLRQRLEWAFGLADKPVIAIKGELE